MRALRIGLTGLFLAALSVMGFTTPALAATGQIAINQTSASTLPSGQVFTHLVSVSCSDVAVSTCTNLIVHFPLSGIPSSWTASAYGAAVASSQIVGGELQATLAGINAGDSVTFNLNVSSPVFSSINGESFSIQPYLTGDSIPTVTAAQTVSGTVTAEVVGPSAFTYADATTTLAGTNAGWTVGIDCWAGSDYYGKQISPGPFTVTTALPAGTTLVSSPPSGVAYDPIARTLSWSKNCSTSNEDVFPISLSTAGIPEGTILTVSTTITGTRADGQPVSSTAAGNTTLVATVNTSGLVTKYGYTDFYNQTRTPAYSTAAGAWKPETINYTLASNGQGPENVLWDYTDNLPCLDAPNGAIYAGLPMGSAPCQAPAFHLTRINIYTGNGDFPAGWAPVATAPDGSTTVLTGTASGTSTNFDVPADLTVSTIYLPVTSSRSPSIELHGYGDLALAPGSIVRNTSTSTFTGAGVPAGTTATTPPMDIAIDASSSIFFINKIGRSSDFRGLGFPVGETYRVNSSGSTTTGGYTAPIVVADLLPAGVKSTLPAGTTLVGSTANVFPRAVMAINGAAVASQTPVTVIDNYAGSGRQLVRYQIPVTASSYSYSSNVWLPVTATDGSRLGAGAYANTVNMFYTGSPTLSCSPDGSAPAGPTDQAPSTSDPLDLNGDGSTTSSSCAASFTITRVLPYGNPGFQIDKTVQGDIDAGPQASPAVGHVSAPGGSSTYRVNFRNTGGTPLNSAVVYDILPSIGDTGISQAQAGSPRGSEYRPTLTSVDPAPAGTTIEYTTASNPCRDEVFANSANTGCLDDWNVAAPADLASVTGLRMRITAQLPSGDTRTMTFSMNSPGGLDGKIAWNTAAGSATDDHDARLLSSEPPKVGLTPGHPALVINKKVDTIDPVAVGQTLTYTVTAENTGNLDLPNVVVYDRLPTGLTLVPGSTDAVSTPDGALSWKIPSLKVGQTATFTLQATVDAGAQPAALLINRAYVDETSGCTSTSCTPPPSTQTPCQGSSDRIQTCATVRVDGVAPAPGLTIDKRADKPSTAPGDPVRYTITVANTGNTILTGILLTDTLPTGMTVVSTEPSATSTSSSLTWTIPNLAPSETSTFVVTAKTDTAARDGDSLTNTVTVNSTADCSSEGCIPPPTTTTPCLDAEGACATVVVAKSGSPVPTPSEPTPTQPSLVGSDPITTVLAWTGFSGAFMACYAATGALVGLVLMIRRRRQTRS